MKLANVLLSTLLALSFNTNAAPDKSLEHQVSAYFAAQVKVEYKNSTPQDVDSLLALLGDDARFEHPRFNAVQTKAQYKKGLLHYLGQYSRCKITQLDSMQGLNALFVRYSHHCADNDGVFQAKDIEQLTTLFEFKQGKIALIRHYF